MKLRYLIDNSTFDVNTNYKVYVGDHNDNSKLVYSGDNHPDYDVPEHYLNSEITYITTDDKGIVIEIKPALRNFADAEEAKEWGQKCPELQESSTGTMMITVAGVKHLLSVDCRNYEEDVWDKCHKILEYQTKLIGVNHTDFSDDDVAELRDTVLDFIESKYNFIYLDAFDEF